MDHRDRRDGETGTRAWWRSLAAAVPIVLVNLVAFAGQLAFLRARLPWPLPGQVTVAVALESVAVYLAWQAHLAMLADDSALRLRLASYAFAAVIGACNYSHYMRASWRPTFPAVAVALMSASSPWLWGVHSRRASRDRLRDLGLIEPHALRLGITRWAWHPVRSARVMWLATWEGLTDPRAAIPAWEARRSPGRSPGSLPALPQGEPPGKAGRPRPGAPSGGVPGVPSPVSPQGSPAAVRRVRRKGGRGSSDEEVREAIREMLAGGDPVSANRVKVTLGLGDERAGRLLAGVRAERPALALAEDARRARRVRGSGT